MVTSLPCGESTSSNSSPENFIRPYGEADSAPEASTVLKWIKPFNCEWLTRPKVAVSELSDSVIKNVHLLQLYMKEEECVLQPDFIQHTLSGLSPLMKSLEKLHKDAPEAPTKADVVRCLRFLYESNDTLDNEIDELFQLGGALFILAAQYIVARTVIRSPEAYAEIVQTDNGSDADFKRERTIKGMLEFISDECCRSKKPTMRSSEERLRMLNALDNMLEDSGASSPSTSSRKPRSHDSAHPFRSMTLSHVAQGTLTGQERDSESSGDFTKAPPKSPAKPSKNAAKDSHSKKDKASAKRQQSPRKPKTKTAHLRESPQKRKQMTALPRRPRLQLQVQQSSLKTTTEPVPLRRQMYQLPVQGSPPKIKTKTAPPRKSELTTMVTIRNPMTNPK
ncbi:hypothetical protein OS493_019931 [Desmophyllum pertusum]|uniref:Uncharacterized protein n=1 Tax=Desmophyllum pertusum TaxID=174260 RepID=A0A9X0CLK6_9CNID|nr:hypothetical protein OS493_019931 [Desmophyllum pertusum]